MNELVAGAVALLQSRSAITAVVNSADIYDTDLPPDFCKLPQARPAIVLMEQPDGDYDASAPVVSLSLEAHCYGVNVAGARAVYRALYDGLRGADGQALNNVTVGGIKWGSAYVDGAPQPQQDANTTWEFVLCTVRALVRAN